MSSVTIRVVDLYKRYGETDVVKGISFSVKSGEIFGILGPNGAGKTTTLECIEGLIEPTSGSIDVLGFTPANLPLEKVGIQIQNAQTFSRIRIKELLKLYRALYNLSYSIEPLITDLLLEEKLDNYFSELSGGQKQRVFIALALIHNPEVLILDEITSGLDPEARHKIWDILLKLKSQGKTIVLTSHYVEEVERLCDRIMLIKNGGVVAIDTAKNLVSKMGEWKSISIQTSGKINIASLLNISDFRIIDHDSNHLEVSYRNPEFIQQIVDLVYSQELIIENISTREPKLEEIILQLVGQKEG